METRKQMAERLESLGVTGAAALAILWETGPARHAARVEQAVATARLAGRALIGIGPDEDLTEAGEWPADLAGALICVLDGYGIGGRGDVEGRATVRVPQLRGLGKGRRQASDGPAWSAAIAEAARRLGAPLLITPSECGTAVLVTGRPVEPHSCESILIHLPAIATAALSAWLTTLARDGLRTSLGYDSWFLRSGVLGELGAAEPAAWARLVNGLPEPAASDPAGG